MYRHLNNINITLAPLQEGMFNDCKSNVKIMESSLVAVPTIASNIASYNDDYGILVDDREDFLNKVHIQTMRIFVKALKELYFPYTRFNRINQNMQWNPEIDIKKVREYKLKRILK